MKYALAYNADVLPAMAALDPLVQEQIIDEIENLAAGTIPLPPPRRGMPQMVHDFILQSPHAHLYVFVSLIHEQPGNLIRIIRIGWHQRSID